MKKIIMIVLMVATLGVAAFFLYKKFVKRSNENEDMEPEQAPIPAQGFPVWPSILTSEVQGVALVTKSPGNLRVSGDNWQGKTSEYKGFECFSDWAYGVRALLKTLKTYMDKHGCDTIEKIIGRYAPPNENNTKGYIMNMMLWTGKQADTKLSYTDIPALATAIIRQETGISSANTPFLFNYVKQVNDYFKVL